MEIRLLRENDNRSGFHSGDPDLDRFFRHYAGQNQFKHYIGATYVAVDDERIVGYATVAPSQVEVEDLPTTEVKQLPSYPLPVLRLARLAVDESAQGQGLGLQLLRFVFRLALKMAGDYGCFGVIVDAKPESVSFYRRFGFIPLDVLEGQSDARPQPKALFLSMRAIRAATPSRSRKT